jgi:hypothetical protein
MAADPRPEVTIGAEAVALGALWTHLRPAGDVFWRAAHHYYLSGRREGSEAGALWEAAGRGRETDGLVGRPSLWAPIRMAARPARLRRAGLRLLRK